MATRSWTLRTKITSLHQRDELKIVTNMFLIYLYLNGRHCPNSGLQPATIFRYQLRLRSAAVIMWVFIALALDQPQGFHVRMLHGPDEQSLESSVRQIFSSGVSEDGPGPTADAGPRASQEVVDSTAIFDRPDSISRCRKNHGLVACIPWGNVWASRLVLCRRRCNRGFLLQS